MRAALAAVLEVAIFVQTLRIFLAHLRATAHLRAPIEAGAEDPVTLTNGESSSAA